MFLVAMPLLLVAMHLVLFLLFKLSCNSLRVALSVLCVSMVVQPIELVWKRKRRISRMLLSSKTLFCCDSFGLACPHERVNPRVRPKASLGWNGDFAIKVRRRGGGARFAAGATICFRIPCGHRCRFPIFFSTEFGKGLNPARLAGG